MQSIISGSGVPFGGLVILVCASFLSFRVWALGTHGLSAYQWQGISRVYTCPPRPLNETNTPRIPRRHVLLYLCLESPDTFCQVVDTRGVVALAHVTSRDL